MKRTILVLAAFIVTGLSMHAQQKKSENKKVQVDTPALSAKVGSTPIKQGNWLIGSSVGSMGFSFESDSFNVSIDPFAAYFITDGIAVGLKLGAGLQTVESEKNVWMYKFMPFGRYYFPEGSSETGRFFGQAEVGVSGYSATQSETSFAFGVAAGYSHFISRNVALEGTFGYNYSKSNEANASAQNGLGLAVGFQIFLGK